jgi:hypothetical protein
MDRVPEKGTLSRLTKDEQDITAIKRGWGRHRGSLGIKLISPNEP